MGVVDNQQHTFHLREIIALEQQRRTHGCEPIGRAVGKIEPGLWINAPTVAVKSLACRARLLLAPPAKE
jgi:hypothetical protein